MKVEATLTTESKNAHAAADAIKIDNVDMDGLKVATEVSEGHVETHIECGSVATMLNTLDDVIRCQIISEELM